MVVDAAYWRRKQLRRSFSAIGWILLVYYGIMNVAVMLAMIVEMTIRMMFSLAEGNVDGLWAAMEIAQSSAWGYFLAVAVGMIILLCWRKTKFWKEQIWAKGKPMTPGAFFGILCIFLSCQSIYQNVASAIEMLLNTMGLSMLEGLEAMSVGSDSFSMFLYIGILAPISEEILFRGLIQKSLTPYGNKFAIFCSAFTFGIFHGNLLQSPYAFLVGLVLGYVAAEYSLGWAMLLHMINNLVIADMLTRLTAGLPELTASLIIGVIISAFAVAAIVVAVVRRKQIRAYLRRERMNGEYLKCFFSSAGMIVLMVLMGISMILMAFMMISPL